MPANPLAVIASRFLGIIPAAPDSQRMGAGGDAQVLSAGGVPIGGQKTIAAAPRTPLNVPDQQLSRASLLETLRGNTVELEAPPQAIGGQPAIANESPSVQGASTPSYAPDIAPSIAPVLAGTISMVTQVPTVQQAIAQQNSIISQALVSRETNTDRGRKTVTEVFSRTPSVPINQQSLVSQQTNTQGGIKTVTKVYSA